MPAPNPNIAVLCDLENQPKSSPNLKGKGLSITVNLFVIAALFTNVLQSVVFLLDGKYSNQSIYNCADEWCSKGHKISAGVVSYYKAYYTK